MEGKISATIEDYLGVIYVLERDNEPVVGARLAELLGVTPPTVTNTLKRMARDGLITLEPGGPHLTEQGFDAARSLMRRHMLSEWMLSRLLSWSRVHKQAHELEHAISEEIEAALNEELNQPGLCPHGNPLPGFESLASDWEVLTLIPVGEKVIIRRIHEMAEETPQLLEYLEGNKIVPGQETVIEEVLPFNQTVTLNLDGKTVSVGFAVARYIYVERAGQSQEKLRKV